jgi:hypothetical protein
MSKYNRNPKARRARKWGKNVGDTMNHGLNPAVDKGHGKSGRKVRRSKSQDEW